MTSLRNELYSYIRKKYNTDPEYLWHRYPGYAVFRHSDNDKWLLKVYEPERFTFERLGRDYGIYAVRGPRGIPDSLSEALNAQWYEYEEEYELAPAAWLNSSKRIH